MIRVLVVDDSPLQRELLAETLREDPDIEVVGTAVDGLEAVQLVEKLRPDLVTMDVQMPRMDGYAATEEIMVNHPTPIVIVSGSHSRPDVEKTMNSLKAGALTVITKPSSVQSTQFDAWAVNFIDIVKSMSEVQVIRKRRRAVTPSEPDLQTDAVPCDSLPLPFRPKVIAIAASTGGPQTLHQLLSPLPHSFPIPILIVQHISMGFLSGFAGWLDQAVSLEVRIAQAEEKIAPGKIYLAQEGWHMGLTPDGRIQKTEEPPVEGFRPAGTILFHSVAQSFGAEVLAFILTGMGRDGAEGLKSIRNAGGHVIAQNEASSVVFGMPKAAIEAGNVDQVLSLAEIAAVLSQLA